MNGTGTSSAQCLSGFCVRHYLKGTATCGDGIIDTGYGEQCDPPGGCCDGNCQLLPSGAICRASSGDCDLPEVCSGVSAFCPDNVLKAPGSICRAALGPCDQPEYCDGSRSSCPTDYKYPAGNMLLYVIIGVVILFSFLSKNEGKKPLHRRNEIYEC